MTTSTRLQNCYIHLYSELRRFIWDYNAVFTLGNLEAAVYQRFPDMDDVKKWLNMMYMEARSTTRDDEAVMKAFDEFFRALEPSNNIYSKLPQVEEVIIYEN